jgi:integrase
MENDAKSRSTIRGTQKRPSLLTRNTNLDNPEEVKAFIARRNVSDGQKKLLAISYKKYAQYYKINWVMPKYKPKAKAIKIPTKEKIEMMIAKARKPLSIKIQMSMETGFRPIEIYGLRVKDVDLEKRLLYPTTAKDGASKIGKITPNLANILTEYINKNQLTRDDKLFNGKPEQYGANYREMRNRLADKLHDPTIRSIRLYDLRHYYATTLYARTRDILLVKQQMGHKRIETTLIYTQLLNPNEDEWTCKVAQNITEVTQLVEAGF